MLEAYATLGFLAACTHRVRLHVLATGVTYRHPVALAQQALTIAAPRAAGSSWGSAPANGR